MAKFSKHFKHNHTIIYYVSSKSSLVKINRRQKPTHTYASEKKKVSATYTKRIYNMTTTSAIND
jgi:ferritin